MKKPLPHYFLVDDVYVKVYADGEDVVAINHWANPYPPFKALFDGVEVSRAAYEKAVSERQGLPIPARSLASATASE